VLSSRLPATVRLEAARVLGSLCTQGLEKDAERLTATDSPATLVSRLAAAWMLKRHETEAIPVLKRLMRDRQPAVAAPAVSRLIEMDPKGVTPVLPSLLTGPAALRSLAVRVCRLDPTEERVSLLSERLNDPDPEVRIQARQALEELAKRRRFRQRIIADVMELLSGRKWRSLEQATILLVQLDHKKAAPPLVKLLTFDRPEVYITAAWGLRKLAVSATLKQVTDYVRKKQRDLRERANHADATFVPLDHQLSQLNQFLGQTRYPDAEPVLREFIPRMERPMRAAVCPESRAAAIWALGLIHAGKVDEDLVRQVEERLNDVQSLPREDVRVCRMCAVTLGRMRARQTLISLRRYCQDQKPSFDPINNACGWAIERITGKPMRPPGIEREVNPETFFLTPSG
jgi:HEAT repeat protein